MTAIKHIMKKTPSEKLSKITRCRSCKWDKLLPWFSLPAQPPANAFLKKRDAVHAEKSYPLDLVYCPRCELIQLHHVVDPEILFGKYVYLSSTSKVFRDHFEKMATDALLTGLVNEGDLVVDVGSNDGILLKPFHKRGVRVAGVEPCSSIAQMTRKEKIYTITGYFTEKAAGQIYTRMGAAKLITFTNVFAHVDNIDGFISAAKFLLADDGHILLEFPDTMEMLKHGTFDLIYHEHLSYFTIPSITRYLMRQGFFVDSIERVSVHGGSLRVIAHVSFGGGCSMSVTRMFEKERGFTQEQLFHTFGKRGAAHKEKLMTLLTKLRIKDGKYLVGYGAPAKMSTLTNSYGITSDMVGTIIDDSPAKQGLLSPGQHIPVISPQQFIFDDAKTVIIFAWNFAESIMLKLIEQGFTGDFLIPYPHPKIISQKRKARHAKTRQRRSV